MSAVSGAFLRTLFSHFFRQVRIKAQRVLSSCIDVFDNFARTLVPPTLSKLQNNPDVSHEEFKVCCPFIVGYTCSLSQKFLQFSHVLRLSSNFPMQWFETRRYLKWLLQLGVKLIFFSEILQSGSQFKKKLVAIFKDKQNLSLRCQRSRETLQN